MAGGARLPTLARGLSFRELPPPARYGLPAERPAGLCLGGEQQDRNPFRASPDWSWGRPTRGFRSCDDWLKPSTSPWANWWTGYPAPGSRLRGSGQEGSVGGGKYRGDKSEARQAARREEPKDLRARRGMVDLMVLHPRPQAPGEGRSGLARQKAAYCEAVRGAGGPTGRAEILPVSGGARAAADV